MGNTQSSSHERYTGLGNESNSALHVDPSQVPSLATASNVPASSTQSPSSPSNEPVSRLRRNVYSSLRRRRTTPLVPLPTNSVQNPQSERDGEREDRPLVPDTMDIDNEFDSANATPLSDLNPSNRSSRLGSRFLPDSVARILLSSGEETADEGEALRNGAAERPMNPASTHTSLRSSNRFSITGSLRRRLDNRPDIRTDPRRHTIRGPFPLDASHQILSGDSGSAMELDSDSSLQSYPSQIGPRNFNSGSRLRRVRNSLSNPLQYLTSHSQRLQVPRSEASHNNPARRLATDDSAQLLPTLASADHRTSGDEMPQELDAVESEARNLSSTPTFTAGLSTARRFPHTLRTRSTRLLRRTENPPLSQVLELAAAAIAAQLSGHTTVAPRGARPPGGDAFDGSIQNFVHTLQEAASAQADTGADTTALDGDLPPVNFMRVFQFPNDENGSPITSQAHLRGQATNAIDDTPGLVDGDRSVTLVLVGVRSMPQEPTSSNTEPRPSSSSLDNFLNIPFFTPTNLLSRGASGAFFRRSDGRHRIGSRRRSLTNFRFPAQYESQRHQPTRVPTTGSLLESSHESTVTPMSESPPGPHPPPSTPADIRSGHVTPVRRPSSASAINGGLLPDLAEDNTPDSAGQTSDIAQNMAHQRRRSDSEFARRPDLGSGAARRNGVVEPDSMPPGIGRSWLIYVVGTNVSSDHPAFTMPSLFTDNPSYEDMQMLSALLGPVKPPVATEEDVSASGGLFRVVLKDLSLIFEPVGDGSSQSVTLDGAQRCLICLSDYEVAEEVRMLHKCRHVYHRECIDEWLTTGRNSCPMCRGEGVSPCTATPNNRTDHVSTDP